MRHVSEYAAALVKWKQSPLELTELDFDTLADFGGTAEAQRAREAQKHAQLALLGAQKTLRTKAAPDETTAFVDALEHALRQALAPVVARLRALEASLADLPALRAQVDALETRALARMMEEPDLTE